MANVGVSMTSDLDHIAANSASITQATSQASSSSHCPAMLTPGSRELHGTDSVLNLDHLELLHHFCTVTYKMMSPQTDQQDTWQVGALSFLPGMTMLCTVLVFLH